MSFNRAGPPFSSKATAVEIRHALALEGGSGGETNPCASFFASPAQCSAWGPTHLLSLTIVPLHNAEKGPAENEFIQHGKEKRGIASAYTEFQRDQQYRPVNISIQYTSYILSSRTRAWRDNHTVSSPPWRRVASEEVVAFNKDGRLPGNCGVDSVAAMLLADGRREARAQLEVVGQNSVVQLYAHPHPYT
jgi:hypothetical protein